MEEGTLEETVEIRPGTPWWHFGWKEVWHYKHLLYFLTKRDLALIYKQTLLGPLHLFIRPFIMTVLFQIVFSGIGKMSTDGIHPFLFYFSNNTFWAFFAGTFGSVSSVFIAGKSIMGKVYFPRIIVPFATLMTTLFSLIIQLFFLLILIPVFYYIFHSKHPGLGILLLVPAILQFAMIGSGVGLFFACLTTKYRDLNSLSNVIVQSLMYLSPIIYPFTSIDEKFQMLAAFNPIASAMELMRFSLFGEATVTWGLMGIGWIMTILLFTSGLIMFNLVQRKFIDVI